MRPGSRRRREGERPVSTVIALPVSPGGTGPGRCCITPQRPGGCATVGSTKGQAPGVCTGSWRPREVTMERLSGPFWPE